MWKGGELQVQKEGGGGWTRGVVMVGMELRQQHGMENSTK